MRRQQTVGHVTADGSGGVLGSLQGAADVVVVTIGILNNTGGDGLTVLVEADLAILVPGQAVLDLAGLLGLLGLGLAHLGNGVGDDTVLIEGVCVVRRQQTVGQIGTDGSGGVTGSLQGAAEVVVVTLSVLNDTGGDSLTVLVEAELAVLVPDQTVLDLAGLLGLLGLGLIGLRSNGIGDDTVLVEDVNHSGIQQTVGLVGTNGSGGILGGLQGAADVVEVTLIVLNNTGIRSDTVLKIEDIAGLVLIQTNVVAQPYTVLGEQQVLCHTALRRRCAAQTLQTDTSEVEEVHLAVQGDPLVDEPSAGPAVGSTDLQLYPIAANQNTILKHVIVTVDGLLAIHSCEGLGAEVVLVAAVCDPTGLNLAADEEVVAAVCLDQTVTGDGLAASGAGQHAVHNHVGVAGGRNGGTEVCDGLTGLAVGTTGVTVLGTGGSLILHSQGNNHVGGACGIVLVGLDTVIVTAVPLLVPRLVTDVVHTGGAGGGVSVTAHLGIHLNGGACEGSGGAVSEGNDTAVDLDVDVHGQDLIALLVVGIHPDLTGMTVDSHDGIQLPGTDGNGDQSGLAGQLHVTGLLDGDGSDLLVLNEGVGSGEALGHVHVIQVPGAHVVQVQSHGDALDVLNGCGDYVDVVQGAEEDAVSIGIVSHNLNGGIVNRVDGDLADDGAVVAHLVADGELHDVAAVSQLHVVQSHLGGTGPDQLVGEVHIVDVDLTGGGVDTGGVGLGGVLGDRSGEADGVGGHGLTLQRSTLIHAGSQVDNVAEHGRLTIVHSRGIIDGDVIDVEGILTVYVVMLTVNVAVLAVLLVDVELQELVSVQECGALEGADINGDVIPAGLIHSVHEAGLGLLSGTDTNGGVTAGGSQMLHILIHAVDLGVDTEADGLVGHVDPHTDSLGVLKDLALTEVQGTQREACLERIREIDLKAQSIVAVTDAAILGSSQEGLAAYAEVVVV